MDVMTLLVNPELRLFAQDAIAKMDIKCMADVKLAENRLEATLFVLKGMTSDLEERKALHKAAA